MVFTTSNKPYVTILVFWACASFFLCRYPCEGKGTYVDVTRLMEDKLGSSSGYNDAVRPLMNQSDIIEVLVTFELIAIMELNSVQQKFVVNGFLELTWTDELLTWQSSDYGDVSFMHPYPKQVWRPRLILGNTLEERDLFEDDYSPLVVFNNGLVMWTPGSLYPTSCTLDLSKFPFDKQICVINMYSMAYTSKEIRFKPETDHVGLSVFDENGEWDLENATIRAGAFGSLSFFQVRFDVRRLPGFFIINIIVPVFLMSFLNILVFIIPVDSGEKISYGITVLLALTVFMSIVSDQLPRTSKTIPLVTVYLLVLTIQSVCTVIATIFIVFCRHQEEKETKHRKATSFFKVLFRKIKPSTAIKNINISHQMEEVNSEPPSTVMSSLGEKDVVDIMKQSKYPKTSGPKEKQNSTEMAEESTTYINRWRKFGKHLDFIFFIIFTFIWLSLTISFTVVTVID